MKTLKSVLQEIQSGTTSFVPASSDEKDMWDFQPIAKILLYAQNENLLESCIPHKESETSHGWYDLVMVHGGLSHEGEMFLVEPDDKDAEVNLEQIIHLKPSIYGVGIDLSALWKRWKTRKG